MIAFDRSSNVSGGITQGIYVSTYGKGVYRSTDGGSTWSELNSIGMPTTHQHIVCTSNGMLYVIDNSGGGPSGNINKYSNGSWSTISNTGLSSGSIRAIAVDPANVNRLVAADGVGHTSYSSNGGREAGQATSITSRSLRIFLGWQIPMKATWQWAISY